MNETLAVSLVNIPIILVIAIIGYITPSLTRKEIFFGVRIPNDHIEDVNLKKYKAEYNRNYLLTCGLYSILLSAAVCYSSNPGIFIAGIFVLLGISFLNFYYIHLKVRDYKKLNNLTEGKKQVVVVDTSFRSNKGKRIVVSPWWFLISLGIVIANIIIVFLVYDKLPDRIPTHWNIMGQVDAWKRKSIGSVLGLPITGLFITGVMYFSYKMIERAKQQINTANAETSAEQNRLFRLRWSGYIIILNIIILIMFTFTNLIALGVLKVSAAVMSAVTAGFAIIVIGASIAMSLWTGQGGSRIKIKASQSISKNDDNRDDDRYWKLGTIYFNPNDPALFVEKRFGVGWTINFGRPIAVVIFAGIILGAFLIPLVLSLFS